MSIELLSILFVVVFIVILLAGVPLAFATGAVAVVFAYALFGLPGLTLIISRVFTLMGNYVLVSVPLFIFMACILERAGVADAIFRAVHVWFGGVPGGLAVAVIFSCALMATMVGVIGAEIVTMGVIALPAMLSRGYDKRIALGSICAGGGLATLIPPSVVFILYGLRPAFRSDSCTWQASFRVCSSPVPTAPTSSSAAPYRRSWPRPHHLKNASVRCARSWRCWGILSFPAWSP